MCESTGTAGVERTAAILAWSDGGMGVEAMGLRLARRREEAVELRIGGGRASVASGGADESDIAVDGEEEVGAGRKEGWLVGRGVAGLGEGAHCDWLSQFGGLKSVT